jgi:acylphosphatase
MTDRADVARRVRVEGRVQGVGFRAWTVAEARARGLVGWVRNEADGTVSAHLEGPAEAIAGMLSAMERGPAFARVTRVLSEEAPIGGHDGFAARQ